MTNGVRLALAVVAGLGLFGAVVLAVPPGRTGGPAGPAASVAPAHPPDAPSEAASAPTFDAVRVEPGGAALVAGRAEPGGRVEVVAGGAVAGAAVADADGRFVAFLDLPPSPDPRDLSLRDDRGRASAGTVIVAPLAAAGPAVAAGPAIRADAARTAPANAPSPAAGAGAAARPDAAPDAAAAARPPLPDEEAAPVGGALAGGGTGPASRRPGAFEPGLAGTAAAPAPVPRPKPDGAAPAVAAATRALAAVAPIPARAAPASDLVLAKPPRLPVAAEPAEPAEVAATPPPTVPAAAPGPMPTSGGAPNPPDRSAPSDPPPTGTAVPAVALASPASAAPAPDAAGQPPVLLSDEGGVRVIQPALAPGADAELLRTVALDAIAYDDRGAVVLQGRAAGRAVRLYLDGVALLDAPVGEGGTWSASLPGTAPGVYTLRVDELDAAGGVLSRIETPFQREARDDLAALMAEPGAAGQAVATRTVQPGNTLWAIARDRYGRGTMYVTVFAMNRDRIRDPDLIYPGQVFVLPATDGR